MLRTSHPKSYLGFPCVKCKQPVVALSILKEMETPIFTRQEAVDLECPHCHQASSYRLDRLARFEEDQVH